MVLKHHQYIHFKSQGWPHIEQSQSWSTKEKVLWQLMNPQVLLISNTSLTQSPQEFLSKFLISIDIKLTSSTCSTVGVQFVSKYCPAINPKLHSGLVQMYTVIKITGAPRFVICQFEKTSQKKDYKTWSIKMKLLRYLKMQDIMWLNQRFSHIGNTSKPQMPHKRIPN